MNMPFVEIVGAGPGAEDLITVRGQRALHKDELEENSRSLLDTAQQRHSRTDSLCR